jgi:hypothetical protein
VKQRDMALKVLFFLLAGPFDDSGEGDGGCTGKLGCPGQEKNM